MVAVQVLLMNYFLLGLHTDSHYINDVLPIDELSHCPLGCSDCSPINGCYSCKPPFLLFLQREGYKQTGICRRDCPIGFYGVYRGKTGFCTKCDLRGCDNCSSKTFCLKCREGRILYNGRCKKKCPKGTLFSAHSSRCFLPRKENVVQNYNASFNASSNLSVTKPRSEATSVTKLRLEPTSISRTKFPLTKEEKNALRENLRRKRRRRKRKRKRKRRKKKKKMKKERERRKNKLKGKREGKIKIRHWKERRRKLASFEASLKSTLENSHLR